MTRTKTQGKPHIGIPQDLYSELKSEAQAAFLPLNKHVELILRNRVK